MRLLLVLLLLVPPAARAGDGARPDEVDPSAVRVARAMRGGGIGLTVLGGAMMTAGAVMLVNDRIEWDACRRPEVTCLSLREGGTVIGAPLMGAGGALAGAGIGLAVVGQRRLSLAVAVVPRGRGVEAAVATTWVF